MRLSVDENGASVNHLAYIPAEFDYLQDDHKQENISIVFPSIDKKNWALELPWTVVDKGDARVSLTLIDTPESYKEFPFHFEIMVTYVVEGNQLTVSFHVKNNSSKDMPFSLGMVLPLMEGWQASKAVSLIKLLKDDHSITIEPAEFTAQIKDDQIDFSSNEMRLAGGADQAFELTFTIA